MTMNKKTIEDRATDLYSDFVDTIHDSDGGEVGYYLDEGKGNNLAIRALREQDRITKEKCVRAAQNALCDFCPCDLNTCVFDGYSCEKQEQLRNVILKGARQ